MRESSIEWTDATWNPTDGCEVCSPGCANCYAMRMAGRFAAPGRPYEGLVTIAKNKRAVWSGVGRFRPDRLRLPLTWRAPKRVFVNSMSDLFYEAFTNEQIAAAFGVMAAASQHTFMVLTKRAKRMREWFEWARSAQPQTWQRPHACWEYARQAAPDLGSSDWDSEFMKVGHLTAWPLRNVWIGVSVENQAAADERIPELLRTPAQVRFLSCEPLLEAVTLSAKCPPFHAPHLRADRISWVIAGSESGPGARPCDVAWLRSLRDQCAATGVPFFLKQAKCARVDTHDSAGFVSGSKFVVTGGPGSHKKAGGIFGAPYLDGRQHLEFPHG